MRLKGKNRILFITLMVAVMLLTPFTAFASEGSTVLINGYEDEGLNQNSISVSNVIKELNAKDVDDWVDAYLETQAPAIVTTLNNTAIFSVYKVEKSGEDFVITDEKVDISGKVEVGIIDPDNPEVYVPKTIDVSELKNYDIDFANHLKGCSATLTKPGYYYVNFVYEALAGSTDVMIHVVGDGAASEVPAVQTPSAPSEKAAAKPTASKVLVNGESTSFEAYNINGNNYFKLRDLATAVNGTKKQFEVEWSADVKAINLVSEKAYTSVGGEMTAGDGTSKNAVLNTSKIYKDGQEIALTAYNINGNNYFKLRDIAGAFNIGVTWDGTTNTIGIDTTMDYVK
jgi:hypothetical protein